MIPEYLEALDSYVPWLAGAAVLIAYRRQFASLLNSWSAGVRDQGRSGRLGPFEIGEDKRLTGKTADLQPEIAEGKVKIEGNPDQMALLMKAVGVVDGRFFSKSTKAMELAGGCLVQVSTEVAQESGSISAAEALTFVPGVRIQLETDGVGGTLVPSDA